jgi:hypothetical protein
MTTLEKIYPNCEIKGARQVFISGKGWLDVCCTHPEDAHSFKLNDGMVPSGKIEKVNLHLQCNVTGRNIYPDFSIYEY